MTDDAAKNWPLPLPPSVNVERRNQIAAELVFDGVVVPDDHRLAESENSGFLNAYKSLTVDRIFTAALALGTGRAAYDAALKYAKERSQFGQLPRKGESMQFKLDDMPPSWTGGRHTYHAPMYRRRTIIRDYRRARRNSLRRQLQCGLLMRRSKRSAARLAERNPVERTYAIIVLESRRRNHRHHERSSPINWPTRTAQGRSMN